MRKNCAGTRRFAEENVHSFNDMHLAYDLRTRLRPSPDGTSQKYRGDEQAQFDLDFRMEP